MIYENRLKALQESNLKNLRAYEERFGQVNAEKEEEKRKFDEVIRKLQSDCESRIQDLQANYQVKVEEV